MTGTVLNDKKVINGWALFDWANSAYFLVISTAIFPIYFGSISEDTIRLFGVALENTTFYSYIVSLAYLVIAFLSPWLSGMADYSGRKKQYLKFFTWIGGIACIGLFFFNSAERTTVGAIAFALATIGAAGGIVFYNAYLPEIASEDRMDKVSAKGYAYGYIGSVLLLIFCLLMIQKPAWFGIESATLPSRISFALVGIWWIGFAQITFKRLPKDQPVSNIKNIARKGIGEFIGVWRLIRTQPTIIRFLTAFFCYSAGVQTVIYVATLFAQEELKLDSGQLIMTIIIIQIVAIFGAYLFAIVSDKRGNKFSLMVQLVIWIGICLGAYFVQESLQFYILAAFVGLVLGGIQSLSRSTYSKLLHDQTEDVTSYFSFYDILYKVSLVLGSFLFGFVGQITGGMRNSVLALVVLFVLGLIFLSTISIQKEPK